MAYTTSKKESKNKSGAKSTIMNKRNESYKETAAKGHKRNSKLVY